MNKIKWNLEEEREFLRGTNEVIICNECGWLQKSPDEKDLKCVNCGVSFEKSKSNIQNVTGGANAKQSVQNKCI